MNARLTPWREWRFELEGLFREAGFTSDVIRKMDWKDLRARWVEGDSAYETFADEQEASL